MKVILLHNSMYEILEFSSYLANYSSLFRDRQIQDGDVIERTRTYL